MKTPFLNRRSCRLILTAALASGPLAPASWAEYSAPGHGLGHVLSASLDNAALFLETRATWTNQTTPEKPYVVEAWFALPPCEAVPVSRLVMTVWGGTPHYLCHLEVRINGTNLPLAAPLTFGTTNDANAVFSATGPSVCGAGSGVWLVGLPVPGHLLYKDGTSNHVQLTVTTPDSFDGRINHVTLLAVYQSSALANSYEFVIAEGSGDIYRAPTAPQVDARTVPLAPVNPTEATVARLHVLYTYGDLGQNDRLYFNGAQLGGDDVAGWDRVGTGLDFGPNLLSFDVLGRLTASNLVRFSVAAADVPGTRETSLRPQLVVLEVTRPAAVPALAIGLNVLIQWPVSAESYQLEFRPRADAGEWAPVTNAPVVLHGRHTVILPPTSPQQFYRLRKTSEPRP